MSIATTSQLERLAVDLDAAPTFDPNVAAWVTTLVADHDDALIAITNDENERDIVRARALSLAIADLLRREQGAENHMSARIDTQSSPPAAFSVHQLPAGSSQTCGRAAGAPGHRSNERRRSAPC